MSLLLLLLPLTSTMPTKPNLVIILLDDLGWGDPGYQNHSDHLTPNMDRLAREYLQLNQYYTQPVCTPGRSALMTGKYPSRMGLQHETITVCQPRGVPLNERFLSERLKHSGYETHIVGKWHLGFYKWEYTPLSRGFETFYGFLTGSVDYFHHTNQGGYDFRINTKSRNGTIINKNLWDVRGTHSSVLYNARINELIRDRNKSKPLFLYFAMKNPHGPIQPPWTTGLWERYWKVGLGYSKWKGLITNADDQIGSVMNSLEEHGILNNTVIMIMSDNGGYTTRNGNLRGEKRDLYEGGIRSPAILIHPMLKGRGVMNELIHVTDVHLLFTHLGRCGVRAKCYMDDLKDLDGKDPHWMIFHKRKRHRTGFLVNINQVKREAAIREGEYKLRVQWRRVDQAGTLENGYITNRELVILLTDRKRFEAELYNVIKDEEERFNLADMLPEVVLELVYLLQLEVLRVVRPTNDDADEEDMKRICGPDNFGGVWMPWGEGLDK